MHIYRLILYLTLAISSCAHAYMQLEGEYYLAKKPKTHQEAGNQDFENNQAISSQIKSKLRPYVIPDRHPQKPFLDLLFGGRRVTQNETAFISAGFHIISKQPRSFIYVASHPLLPDYLVKVYMDTELRLKRDKPSWSWLRQRCIGAKKIRKIIKKKNIKHFTVASKWIYPLPDTHLPPKDKKHTTHLAILLVEDMQLVSKEINLEMWRHAVTEEVLDELYSILTLAKGSSYRPDNIWYTKNNTFAFIDTEYPTADPDYYSIRKYLNQEMRIYWDALIKNSLR